ncbi:MAG: 2-amino-4-hydroxy-6-hydroxymethyldihydropteridine diphosphokinase [Bacteroidales bacterium]|nr:2-amino-4-hydroxy-6-hydroxymethyldihydropteridine diphosphokinase [Bacteroidales bacterium]
MEKVILSIGSSLGDKYKNLSSAVNHINTHIGSVVKKSEIYESEPWGFNDSNSFFNMAVEVNTELSPDEVLKKIILIENIHFRERNSNSYQARTLDIDIVFFGNLIYTSEYLTIPHKHAHKRLFVLLPVNDIIKNFEHPLLKKTIEFLIEKCEDKSKIVCLNLL